MKIRKYSFLLFVEAVITLIFTKGMNVKTESIFDILSFPLEKIADFLGYLSLKSNTGNIIAIIFFTYSIKKFPVVIVVKLIGVTPNVH